MGVGVSGKRDCAVLARNAGPIRQINVGEERRDDSALRRSGESRSEPPSFFHHSRTEERSKQREHFAVFDAPPYLAHEDTMPNVIEAGLDVSFDYIFVGGSRVDVTNDLGDLVSGSSTRPISVTSPDKSRFQRLAPARA
jgi:hypothetical protein